MNSQRHPHLNFTSNVDDLKDCNIFIVTVPTPIDNHKRPDLTALKKSSQTVGTYLKKVILLFMNQQFIQDATEDDMCTNP